MFAPFIFAENNIYSLKFVGVTMWGVKLTLFMRLGALSLTFFYLLIATPTFARPKASNTEDSTTKSNEDEARSYFEASLEYVSNYQYLGRKDTARLPYIMTNIGYYFKNGLHIAVNPWYANTKVNPHFDLIMLDLGYDHSFSDAFSMGAVLYKYYYSEESKSVKSSMTASAGVYAQYSNNIVQPTLYVGGDVVNHNMDAVINFTLDHSFNFNDRLSLTAMAGTWFGTQYYYRAYLEKDSLNHIKPVLSSASKLKLMSFEFSATLAYETEKWQFSFMADYVVAKNPGQITLQKTTFEEQISNTFFVDIKAARRFYTKKKRR